MPQSAPAVQINEVERLERALSAARQKASSALRLARVDREISLRDAAAGASLSPGALSDLERGRSWQTSTARRVLQWVEGRRQSQKKVA